MLLMPVRIELVKKDGIEVSYNDREGLDVVGHTIPYPRCDPPCMDNIIIYGGGVVCYEILHFP